MSGRGTIKATRLEPETGRLQYFVERNNGDADWHYAKDPAFLGEFADLVKKFIAEPPHREERRRRLTQESNNGNQNQSPKSTASSTAKRPSKAASSVSDADSTSRVPTRVPVRRFKQARIQATVKLARIKREEKDYDDENVRYALLTGANRNGTVPTGLLMPSPKRDKSSHSPSSKSSHQVKKEPLGEPQAKNARKMAVSPTISSHSAEISPKTLANGKQHSKANAVPSQHRRAFSLQELMRKKLDSARNRQLQNERHRHLLGLAHSTVNKLKPVSISISPSNHPLHHQTLIRSPVATAEASPRRRGAGSPMRSPSRGLSREHFEDGLASFAASSKSLLRQQASLHSFVPHPDSFSSTETSSGGEAASTSTASNQGHYSSVRRGPKRQAASGLLSQRRYSQIVLRHRPGWTQLWLFTTTRMQNAINPEVCEELCNALKACIADMDTYLILISSSGPTFCSGVDLNYLLDAKDPAMAGRMMSRSIAELCSVILSCPKPIFVAVNGPAVGIGVGICLLADVVLATEKATFSTPYSQLGHVPEAGLSTTLQNGVGRALAGDMLLTGRRITAVEALRAGLVSRVLWPTNFVQELLVRLDVIAQNCSPALEATKFLLRSASCDDDPQTNQRNDGSTVPESTAIMRAIEAESELLELFYTSPESRSAMRRYLESV